MAESVMEGMINYLDPLSLEVPVGEIYSEGNTHLFKLKDMKAPHKLSLGQKVRFLLDEKGIAIDVSPV